MKTHRSFWLALGLVLLTTAACGGKAEKSGDDSKDTAAQPATDAATPVAADAGTGAKTPQPVEEPQPVQEAQPAEPAAGPDASNVPKEDRDDFDKFVADVQKGLTLAAQIKLLVEEAHRKRGTLPWNADDLGAAPRSVAATAGVESVRFSDGRIVVAYEAHGKLPAGTIELQPVVEGSTIVWNCSGGSLADSYRPASCR